MYGGHHLETLVDHFWLGQLHFYDWVNKEWHKCIYKKILQIKNNFNTEHSDVTIQGLLSVYMLDSATTPHNYTWYLCVYLAIAVLSPSLIFTPSLISFWAFKKGVPSS